MNAVFTVMVKELRQTLRDRRTLISAVILPTLLIPVLILGVGKLQKSLSSKEQRKVLKIALYNAPPAVQQLYQDSGFQIVSGLSLAAARDSVAAETMDGVLDFGPKAATLSPPYEAQEVSFYYKSTNGAAQDRILERLDQYKESLVTSRLSALQITNALTEPLAIQDADMASTQERIGEIAGGFLPYMFLLFCYLGCLYPALDIIAGEKEKGTIETLLTTPADRFAILLGKVMAIGLVGLCSAILTIAGMYAMLQLNSDMPPSLMAAIQDILSLRFVVLLLLMLMPLSLLFASLLAAITIRANSFKEAQSYATPLMFVVLVPAMIALMPGVKLSWQTAFVPILNVALATKEIISGALSMPMYIAILVAGCAYALLGIFISRSQFDRESSVLS